MSSEIFEDVFEDIMKCKGKWQVGIYLVHGLLNLMNKYSYMVIHTGGGVLP